MKEKIIIYKYIDGVNDEYFYDKKHPIELLDYKVSMELMGTSSISATLDLPQCLDSFFDGKQYVKFKGERYFIQNTPSSSYDNTSVMYRHTLNFLSEKDVILSRTLFVDIVTDDSSKDRYQSNSTNVVFFGTLSELVGRLNSISQNYGLNYTFEIDGEDTTEAKMVSFKDKYILDAMKEAYDIFKIPYYFDGKKCHFGKTNGVIKKPFEYGVSSELIKISKSNANSKIIRRITGVGSSDNIPYYYPNNSPKGDIDIEIPSSNILLGRKSLKIKDYSLFANNVEVGDKVIYTQGQATRGKLFLGNQPYQGGSNEPVLLDIPKYPTVSKKLQTEYEVTKDGIFKIGAILFVDGNLQFAPFDTHIISYTLLNDRKQETMVSIVDGTYLLTNRLKRGKYTLILEFEFGYIGKDKYDISIDLSQENSKSWNVERGGDIIAPNIDLNNIGIKLLDNNYQLEDYFQQKVIRKINVSPNLMPSKYRDTYGEERFYNALNNTYKKEDGTYYQFKNIFSPIVRDEHIETRDDIKPTIRGIKNIDNQLFGEIADIAFDATDSDEQDAEGKFLHPYFYVKLHKFSGAYGFNLFDSAIENGAMTFSMIDGNCGGCNFKVGVSEKQNNPIQVDENGNLKRNEKGDVIREGKPQEVQNDTTNNEVWLALKKDISTFGVVMPNATNHYRPQVGDKFVILNINLPQSYITFAEKQLEKAILDKMEEDNDDKFNFDITFSSIFFAQDKQGIEDKLKLNTEISVLYNGVPYTFNILSLSYDVKGDKTLPSISVSLTKEVQSTKTFTERYPNNQQVTAIVQHSIHNAPKQDTPTMNLNGVTDKAQQADKVSKPLIIIDGNNKTQYDGSKEVILRTSQNNDGTIDYLSKQIEKLFSWFGEDEDKDIFVRDNRSFYSLANISAGGKDNGSPSEITTSLSKLVDVSLSSLKDGESLVYDGLRQRWVNKIVQGQGGGGSNVKWGDESNGYAKLIVEESEKNVAIFGHRHDDLYIPKDSIGKANGVVPLDSQSKIPSNYIPGGIDSIQEYPTKSDFPKQGESGKIYIAKDTNKTYRWSGTTYIVISDSLALGETSSTAYAGDKGKANADNITKLLGWFDINGNANNANTLGGVALGDIFMSLLSNTTNPISLNIGGINKAISQFTLRTSLGLKTAAYEVKEYFASKEQLDNGLKLKLDKSTWDDIFEVKEVNGIKEVKVKGALYTNEWISAGGKGTSGGGGGQIGTQVKWDVSSHDKYAILIVGAEQGREIALYGHKHSKDDIINFPTSLPASDVYPWAKGENKPSYNANEVGALPINGGQMQGSIQMGTNWISGYQTIGMMVMDTDYNVFIGGHRQDVPKAYVEIRSNTLKVKGNEVWHKGNFKPSDYLPLIGGTLNSTTNPIPLVLNSNSYQTTIQLTNNGVKKSAFAWDNNGGTYMFNTDSKSYLGLRNDGTPRYNTYTLWHEGNFNPNVYRATASYNIGTSDVGWHRIAKTSSFKSYGTIYITNTYNYGSPSHISFNFSTSYANNNTLYSINQISGTNHYWSKLRIVGSKTNLDEIYIEAYYVRGVLNPYHFRLEEYESCSLYPTLQKGSDLSNTDLVVRCEIDTVRGISTYGSLVAKEMVKTPQIKIGNNTITYDADNNSLRIDGNIYATGFMTAGGKGGDTPKYLETKGGNITGMLSIGYPNTPTNTYPLNVNGDTYLNGALNIQGRDGSYTQGIRLRGVKGLSSIFFNTTNNEGFNAGMTAITAEKGVGLRFRMPINASLRDIVQMREDGNVAVTGNITATGTITPGSDVRFKTIQENFSLQLNSICDAPLFKFIWNDDRQDKSLHIGTSAQYWEVITPELVNEQNNFKYLDYMTLATAIGITNSREIKQLKDRIVELENKLKRYEL